MDLLKSINIAYKNTNEYMLFGHEFQSQISYTKISTINKSC